MTTKYFSARSDTETDSVELRFGATPAGRVKKPMGPAEAAEKINCRNAPDQLANRVRHALLGSIFGVQQRRQGPIMTAAFGRNEAASPCRTLKEPGNPVALERRTHDRAAKAVTYGSEKSEGPTAGTKTADPLEFLARVLVHMPDTGPVTTRYDVWYANRRAGCGVRQSPPPPAPPAIGSAPLLAPTESSRRWAALRQPIVDVDPLACPLCHGVMRIVAFLTQSSVIDQILTHLRTRAARASHAGLRSPPSTRAPVSRGA